MISKTRAGLALALTLPLLHACGGDSNDANVRLVNATSNYATMDLYESTSLVTSGVASGTVSGYVGLGSGSYTFNVKNGGSSSTAASVTQSLDKESHYTLVAYDNAGTLQTSMLDDNESSPDSGTAKLRILNAAPAQVAGIDVYATTSACNALASTDSPVVGNVTGLQGAFDEITASSAGTVLNLCVTATGSKTDLRLALSGVTLKDQQIATLIVTESTGGVLLNGLLLNQGTTLTQYANTNARVRVVADAANAGTVSATVNGTALASLTTSPTVGSYQSVTAGALTTTLSINGTSISTTSLTAAPGGDYTLLVAGTASAPTVTLLTDDNLAPTNASLPVAMRLVNGLNGGSDTAMLTSNGAVVSSDVAFGSASTYTDVAASAAADELQITSGASLLWDVTGQTLTGTKVYSVFLLGDLASPHAVLRQDN